MNKVVEILMKRDGMTKQKAQNHLAYVRQLVEDAVNDNDFDLAEQLVASELGLEMDYIFDILD